MAGSYRDIVDGENNFTGTDYIENLGDAHKALEECYYMIRKLTENNKMQVYLAWRDGYCLEKHSERMEEEPSLFDYQRFWYGT